jgi:hypothetical protein
MEDTRLGEVWVGTLVSRVGMGIEYENEDEYDWGNDCEGASQWILASLNAERQTPNVER